jgi:hypothetical protein
MKGDNNIMPEILVAGGDGFLDSLAATLMRSIWRLHKSFCKTALEVNDLKFA